MNFKYFFLFLIVFALAVFYKVEAASRITRETETAPTEQKNVDKVQEQLMTAFDSFKKSMEELASKINTEEIVQGIQNFTSKLETYAKKTADQIASTASGTTSTDEQPKE